MWCCSCIPLLVLCAVVDVGESTRSRILTGHAPSNCHDCVFAQTKCIQRCLSTYECTKDAVKQGFCPFGGSVVIKNCPKISALAACQSDLDCAGSKKCCNDGCRKICANALPFPPPSTVSSFRPRNKYTTRARRRQSHRRNLRRLWSSGSRKSSVYTILRPRTISVTTTTTTKKPESIAETTEQMTKETQQEEQTEIKHSVESDLTNVA
ncbi:Uncharacterised protein g4282 [Pycnogonum litorale]